MPDHTPRKLRSAAWLQTEGVGALLHRASLRAGGAEPEDDRPVVGICNSWSELVHCNVHFRALARSVARGVVEAGGIPVEFPTSSLSENLMKPTAMMFRNLMSMDVEESIRAHPLDAVVLIGGCDKTVPAQLMGAISADVPAICLTGGPSEPGHFHGRELGVGTDLWKYTDQLRAGTLDATEYARLERALIPSHGHCNEMGTALTMAALLEALGMALSGGATVPAVEGRRAELAARTGAAAVALALADRRPRDILTSRSLENAIVLLMALGGSTNAVIHLLAFAGRLGVELPLARFGELSARTPLLVNVRPSGEHLGNDLDRAGGVPAVLAELGELLHLGERTVTGRTLGEEIADAERHDPSVIGTLREPFAGSGSIAVLHGSLAPDGAIVKRSAASPELLRHRGPALVFDSIEDVARAVEDPDLAAEPETVLVLRGAGPRGGPGMPEWGMLPIPRKLLQRGVEDMVRISDARMSGTAFGTVCLHVAPEAAVGGPIGLLETGDPVVLDVDAGRLDVDLDARELQRRAYRRPVAERRYARGYGALFVDHVLQAPEGCDLDFLATAPEPSRSNLPPGLFSGWVGGW